MCLQAHQMFQQVPVGPDETPRISKVQQRIDAMQARAAALEHKLVPRPTPGQYMDVTAEVQRFVGAMGDLDRVLGLLQGLQVLSGQPVVLTCITAIVENPQDALSYRTPYHQIGYTEDSLQ